MLYNSDKTCFGLHEVIASKKYKVSFSINGPFHIRFSIKNSDLTEHKEFLTKTIYGDIGSYSYILDPSIDGILCICKTPDRENSWISIDKLTVEEIQ